MLNSINFKLSLLAFLLLLSHISFSIFVSSSYTLSRILTSLCLSIAIVIISLNKPFILTFIIKKYFLFYIFCLLLIYQSFNSLYINSSFEIQQQLYISLTILLYMTVILYTINQYHSIKIKTFIRMIILSSIFIYISIFTIYTLNSDYTLVKSIETLFDNRRFFNHLQTLFIPIIFYSMLISKSYKIRILLCLLIILNFYFIFLTGARGTLYSLLISSLIIFFSSNKSIKIKLLYFYYFIVISFIVYQVGLYINDDFTEHSSHFNDIASSGRLYIFTTIIPNIFDFKYFFNAIGFATTDVAVVGFLHPHNLFLYIFLGSGTLGLIIFLYLISKVFFKIYITYISTSSSLYTKFITLTFISVFIHSLVSGVYITPLMSIYLLYFFIVMFRSSSVKINKLDDVSTNAYGTNLNYSTIKSFISGLVFIFIALWYVYLVKVNLDFVIEYNGTMYSKNIPGIFLFNENVYKF